MTQNVSEDTSEQSWNTSASFSPEPKYPEVSDDSQDNVTESDTIPSDELAQLNVMKHIQKIGEDLDDDDFNLDEFHRDIQEKQTVQVCDNILIQQVDWRFGSNQAQRANNFCGFMSSFNETLSDNMSSD